jgi:hypothetical protein
MKITIERKVLEQALDALEDSRYGAPCNRAEVRDAITALREALAQPTALPTNCRHCGGPETVLCGGQCQPAAQPTIDLSRLEPFVGGLGKAILQELKEDLAAQPAAQPTEPAKDIGVEQDERVFARIAAMKAQQESAGEPVRYEYRWTNPAGDPNPDSISMDWCEVEPRWNGTVQEKCAELLAHRYAGKPCYEVRSLYTRPAVPLTVEKIRQLLDDVDEGQEGAEMIIAFARAIEAAHKIGGTP